MLDAVLSELRLMFAAALLCAVAYAALHWYAFRDAVGVA